MKQILTAPFVIGVALFGLIVTVDRAQAQQLPTRTWVSGVGDDTAACSRTAPCKTFAGALGKTTVNGEINCLDSGGFGTVNISKSITIDCTGVLGGILDNSIEAIIINFDSFSSSDSRMTVNLRGLSFNAAGGSFPAVALEGNGLNSHVLLEDITMSGNDGGDYDSGVSDTRVNGSLTLRNVTIKNMAKIGIAVQPTFGTGIIRATLENILVDNCGAGFTSSSGAATIISNSVFTNNAIVGIQVGPASQALVMSTKISHNGTGISFAGLTRLMESAVFLSVNAAVSGTVQSYANNAFVGVIGGTIAPIGSASNPSGLQ